MLVATSRYAGVMRYSDGDKVTAEEREPIVAYDTVILWAGENAWPALMMRLSSYLH